MAIPTKPILMAMLAVGLLGASPPDNMTQPPYREPAQPWADIEAPSRELECRDRIERVRAATGKPKLDRSPANPGEPLLMYAVDTRIDDCGVIIPVADPSDIRQSPPPGVPQLIPAIPGR